MEPVTVSLTEEHLELLEELSGDAGACTNRSEATRMIIDQYNETNEIRDRNGQLLALLSEAVEYLDEREAELKTLREQLEAERDTHVALEERVDKLEAERDDLRRQLQAANARYEQHTELVEFVEEQRELTRYQERRQRLLDDASILKRWKWKLTGVPVDDDRETGE